MRGQSHIVGFVLILGFGVVALGTLTAGVGTVIESQSANADGTRVAADLGDASEVIERTGVQTDRVNFANGQLSTTERTLRVLDGGSVEQTLAVDALVFESGDRQVTSVAGAVIQRAGTSAWLERAPPITTSETNEVLVVGAPILGTDHWSVGADGGISVTLRTNVTHDRTALGRGNFAVAIETATPGPLERYFERQNATTSRRQFSGDEHGSVVATFPTERTGYLVVHDLNLEVRDG
ncbi:hypothetical protein SAMN05216226_109156 [Halovenus aranensis]|jgi:hypothetical protein|uniref:Flagellin N-terminal-like domain-containing protein n=1 Tax=Halovenus aranensis TaxID=890420 RepID=A0A1G8WSK0_9EURY|nr:hypothetical protein [Halovenus aranensis]SDJ80605.1 hypothetical protein SAMN05216226_109156 [Halovenus aranensis]